MSGVKLHTKQHSRHLYRFAGGGWCRLIDWWCHPYVGQGVHSVLLHHFAGRWWIASQVIRDDAHMMGRPPSCQLGIFLFLPLLCHGRARGELKFACKQDSPPSLPAPSLSRDHLVAVYIDPLVLLCFAARAHGARTSQMHTPSRPKGQRWQLLYLSFMSWLCFFHHLRTTLTYFSHEIGREGPKSSAK